MSFKDTDISGNLNVSRNANVGGNAVINGRARISGGLRVGGWLDAPNIKGPQKGLFRDATKLREAYPRPHDGWWALVGSGLPAKIYIAEYGSWVATGEEGGEFTLDIEQYEDAIDELMECFSTMREKIIDVEGRLSLLTPVRCEDEDDLKAKVASGDYAVGQQFYIPEED